MAFGDEFKNRGANGVQHVLGVLEVFRAGVASHFEENVINHITLFDEFP
jgi:hypothetical protein